MAQIAEPVERVVEEVHCIDCGAPMPVIPSWYASVNVKFTCDNCRQKSPRLSPLPTLEPEAHSAILSDTEAEPIMEDADIDAEDLEVAEIEDVDLGEGSEE